MAGSFHELLESFDVGALISITLRRRQPDHGYLDREPSFAIPREGSLYSVKAITQSANIPSRQ